MSTMGKVKTSHSKYLIVALDNRTNGENYVGRNIN